jgi:hypothetical protein
LGGRRPCRRVAAPATLTSRFGATTKTWLES